MLNRIFAISSVIIISLCAFWSTFLRDPHLLGLRKYETGLLLLFILLATSLAIYAKRKLLKNCVFAISIILIIVVLSSEMRIQKLKNEVLLNPTPAIKEINRHLIIGFDDYAEVERLSMNQIAGIFLTKRNIEGRSFAEIRQRINDLQKERLLGKLPPLIIATDQEGGPVSRLSPLVERQPPLSSILSAENADKAAYDYGIKQGTQLRDIGVTVNFSPVVDLMPEGSRVELDFHTLLHTRAISSSPQEVISIALPYIKGLERAGVNSTLKHFPGLRGASADTHHLSAVLETPVEELEKVDWVPFLNLASATDTWIMLSHLVLADIDDANPVSTSKRVVDEILRKRFNFTGILVTDDLTMGATYNRGFCKSVRGAYGADIDYLLIAYDYEKYYELIACIVENESQSD